MLRLALLGTPEISLDSKSLTEQITGRSLALLVYLAVTGQEYTRNRLADLLWDEHSNDDALKKVRNLLPGLRVAVDDHLQITRESIAFKRTSAYWLDVAEFRTYLSTNLVNPDPVLLENVLALYRDDFLGDFAVRNAPLFEAWMVQEREALHQLAVAGFQCLTRCYLEQENPEAGLRSVKRLLALEPWCEEAYQQQMIFLSWCGKRDAALAQYLVCQRVLAAEFNSAPMAATTAIYEQIRTGELRGLRNRKSSDALRLAQHVEHLLNPLAEKEPAPTPPAPLPPPAQQLLWNEIPQQHKFYGYQWELRRLTEWWATGCRLIGIFGLVGQGKSALGSYFCQSLRESLRSSTPFDLAPTEVAEPPAKNGEPRQVDTIIWRSAHNVVAPVQLVQDWLAQLTGQPPPATQEWQQLLALLIAQLAHKRCLLVLDNLDRLMQRDANTGRYHPDWAKYSELLCWIGTSQHQSCLLLLSRESPLEFARWEEQSTTIRSLQLTGLDEADGCQLLTAHGLTAPTGLSAKLTQRYSGNPLALLIAAETIQQLFNGDVERFLAAETLIFDDLRTMFDDQFSQLGAVEREILLHVVIDTEILAPEKLWSTLALPASRRTYLEAQRALLRRAWLESQQSGLVIPNLVLEYLAEYIVEEVVRELLIGHQAVADAQAFLNRYALVNTLPPIASSKPRHRPVLQGVAEQLTARLGEAKTYTYIQSLVAALQTQVALPPGHASLNLYQLAQYLALVNVDVQPPLPHWEIHPPLATAQPLQSPPAERKNDEQSVGLSQTFLDLDLLLVPLA